MCLKIHRNITVQKNDDNVNDVKENEHVPES
jgi:hypothetical protein